MADKLGGIISYLIGVGLMTYFLFVFKEKGRNQAGLKFYGVSLNKIIMLTYVGIAIFLFLTIAVLLGWTK